jgi:hypothetical protein
MSPMTDTDPAGMRAAPVRKTPSSHRLGHCHMALKTARRRSGAIAIRQHFTRELLKPNKRLVAGNRCSDRRRAIGVVDYAGHALPLRSNVTVSNCSINRRSADHDIAVDSFEPEPQMQALRSTS